MRKLTGLYCAGILLGAVLALAASGCTRAKPEAPTPTIAVTSSSGTTTPAVNATVVFTPQAPPTALSLTPGPTTISVAQPSPGSATPIAYPTAGSPPAVPGEARHTVAWGDTVYSIARLYGTTAQAIVDANNLTTPDFVRVGQELRIPGAVAPPAGSGQEYVVQTGDTLFSIARRFNTTVSAITLANGILNPALIRAGQALIIPAAGSQGTAAPEGTTYIVQAGDTLTSIAARFGKTTWDIVVANNLPDPQTIFVGQTLVIP